MHTAGASNCGRVAASIIPKLYKDVGFGGIVVTNHFSKHHLKFIGAKSWEDGVNRYVKGYEAAKRAGESIGLRVFFGLELHLKEYLPHGAVTDLLVYGITKQDLLEHRFIFNYTHKQLFELAEKKGWLIYQAHPARAMDIFSNSFAPPHLIHGVEVYNASGFWYESDANNNHKALEFANKHKLKQIAGSDFHNVGCEGSAGIYVPNSVDSIESLVAYLKAEQPRLITNVKD